MEVTNQTGRTVEREMFIAAAPERVFQAFTTREGLEAWFGTRVEIDLRPGGVFNMWWQEEYVVGEIVRFDRPRQLIFTWDDGPQYGVTTCTVDFIPESDGTLVRLCHTGFGDSENWDALYDGIIGGWVAELANLKRWAETGIRKTWA